MDLKEFVSTTLVRITEGVRDAQAAVLDAGGVVNPATHAVSSERDRSHFASFGDGRSVFLVDFDVAVTSTEGVSGKAKASIRVAGVIDIGAGGGGETNNAATNRIRFKVPLGLPVDPATEEGLREQRLSNERDMEDLVSRNRY